MSCTSTSASRAKDRGPESEAPSASGEIGVCSAILPRLATVEARR